MFARIGTVVATVLIATLGLPQLASAQEVAVTGVVVRIDAGQATFWLQDYSSPNQGRVWSVRTTNAGPLGQANLGMQVGDVVEVRGVVIGANALLARSITFRSRGGGPAIGPNPGVGTPPVVGRPGQQIEIQGVIMTMDLIRQGLLQIQDRRRNLAGSVWNVRVTGQTRIEGRRGERGWDDNDRWDGDDRWDDGRGLPTARRLLQVGDLVTVEGRFVGGGQILATEITVRGRGYALPPTYPYPSPTYPYPSPAYPYPSPTPNPTYGWQTVILSPQAGSEVSGTEFTVVGRTIPGARVQVHVQARWSLFSVQVANSTVTADQNGIFVLAVRPSTRIPGATYTITATPTYQGVSMTPVSVTVRQI